jgi:hypothetical protein
MIDRWVSRNRIKIIFTNILEKETIIPAIKNRRYTKNEYRLLMMPKKNITKTKPAA